MKNDSVIMHFLGGPRFSKISDASSPDRFPPKMPLGQFLFEYLYRRGVRHSFGLPGDFALPTFAWLEKSKIQCITVTHEPAAGFAADAYSQINGIGLHSAGARGGDALRLGFTAGDCCSPIVFA